jgi:hypothetical protein
MAEGKRIEIAVSSAKERERFIDAYFNEFEIARDHGDTVLMKRREVSRSAKREASERRWGWFAILFSFLGENPTQTASPALQSDNLSVPPVPRDVEFIEMTLKAR